MHYLSKLANESKTCLIIKRKVHNENEIINGIFQKISERELQ